VSYKQLFESLAKAVDCTEAWITSSMPRGGLQILQPSGLPDGRVKAYSHDFHEFDCASWQAIIQKRALKGDDCFPNSLTSTRFFENFMEPADLRYLAVAPLVQPLLPGYPGALCAFRRSQEGDFSDHDLRLLSDQAKLFDRFASEVRGGREDEDYRRISWLKRPTTRQFIFDSKLKSQLAPEIDLEDKVAEQVLRDARHRMAHLSNADPTDRLAVPDAEGNLWTFCVVPLASYPALGTGSFIMYCLEPEYGDWQVVRASDFAADPEIVRLIPAMQYMMKEYAKGVTLNSIAKMAHLSPFHFHRRFTDLLGITPKHYLLLCQIFHAKKMLLAREKDLIDIAADCGFAHQSHFTSRFKQATGLTPTKWRRQATKALEEK
jgi:AraC-like DNA-binding protein